MKELTKAEEQIMQILWDLEKAYVKDVLEQLPEPKPAYNTVSTIIRILESKGVVAYEVHGKSHKYYPTITKESYRNMATERLMSNYFDNSVENMISYFVNENKLNLDDVDGILKMIEDIKKRPI